MTTILSSAVSTIGKTVRSVANSVLDWNTGTFSGAVDIIIVRRQTADGVVFSSTPFHVKFGILQLMKSSDREVSIEVNGRVIDVSMKLTRNGFAFFPTGYDDDSVSSLISNDEEISMISYDKNKADDENIKAYDENIKADDENIKAYDENIKAYDEKKENNRSRKLHRIRSKSVNSSRNRLLTFNSEKIVLKKPNFNADSNLTRSLSCSRLEILEKNDFSLTKDSDDTLWRFDDVENDICAFKNFYEKKDRLRLSLCKEDLEKLIEKESIETINLEELKEKSAQIIKLFEAKEITMKFLNDNPNVVFDPNVMYMQNKSISIAKKFIPKLISSLAFNQKTQNTPRKKSQNPDKNKIPTHNQPLKPPHQTPQETPESEINKTVRDQKRFLHSISKDGGRTITPSTEQLNRFHLQPGRNLIRFSVTSGLQGTQVVESAAYLWDEDARVVVTDIDGTITRSDVLGFILPSFGNDWAHRDVAKLFRRVGTNGYCVLYLTARLMSLTSMTRHYLFGLNQDKGEQLPAGPIMTVPFGLLTAYRKDHNRRPHDMKIQILKDILKQFQGKNPYYAGFGNKDTDAMSYAAVGIPEARTFIINPTGEIIKHNARQSYGSISDSVDQIFPPIDLSHLKYDVNFGMNYWKAPIEGLEKIELD